MSDSVRSHRRQPTRLPRPWDSPGKNTGVGCHFLLQCVKVKSESEVAQSCPTPSDPMDCSLPGSSIHGIFQARVLEWGAIAFSSPQPWPKPNPSIRPYKAPCPHGVSHTLPGPKEFLTSQDSSDNLSPSQTLQTHHSTLPVWALKILPGCFPFLFQQIQQSKPCLLSGVF